MPAVLLPNSREELRAFYVEAWRKRRERLPAEPLEVQVADVIEQHPEYHRWLEDDPETLAREWTPEGGESNPFLHMGLHLAVREQAGTDRPAGIAAIYGALVARLGRHEAEHRIAEHLAEALWQAQRNQRAPDDVSYLETLRALERDTRA